LERDAWRNNPSFRPRQSEHRANPHGHHILGNLLAQANAGVEALSGNINEPALHIDLDLDIGR
jgi:hypothetical protein